MLFGLHFIIFSTQLGPIIQRNWTLYQHALNCYNTEDYSIKCTHVGNITNITRFTSTMHKHKHFPFTQRITALSFTGLDHQFKLRLKAENAQIKGSIMDPKRSQGQRSHTFYKSTKSEMIQFYVQKNKINLNPQQSGTRSSAAEGNSLRASLVVLLKLLWKMTVFFTEKMATVLSQTSEPERVPELSWFSRQERSLTTPSVHFLSRTVILYRLCERGPIQKHE